MEKLLYFLENLDRRILYLLLIVICSISLLFIKVPVDVNVDAASADLYGMIMTVPQDKTVIIQTDWTNSTRGENMAQLESLVRMLMSRNVKFVFYTATTDAPAVAVSRSVVERINEERVKDHQTAYKWNDDCVSLGLFPNTEGINNAMGQDLRKAWGDRQVKQYNGNVVNVFQTAALKNVNSIKDIPLMIVVTASSTSDIAIERLSDKVQLGLMCTGVTGGTALQYYPAQYHGIASGLKGAYDIEYMMKYGINHDEGNGTKRVQNEKVGKDVPPVANGVSLDRAAKYYVTLHFALTLVILVVIVGNIAMVLRKTLGTAPATPGGQA